MIEYKDVSQGRRTNKGYERVIWNNGDIWYTLDGIIHREGGPAKIFRNGSEIWCINGNVHREDGPAVIYSRRGRKEYWLNNIPVIPERYHLFTPLQLAKLGLI